MTKSKYQKRKAQEARTKRYITADRLFTEADESFLFADADRIEMLRHCHKNIVICPGNLQEGDIVCLTKMRPRKVRRRKLKYSTWKVQYTDIANGFIQLGNSDTFDKEGAEENIAFIRSYNFPITDVWNLDTAFTLFFLPRLKMFIYSTRYSIPNRVYQQYIDNGHTTEEADKLASEEWKNILIQMYEGLTLAYEGPDAKEIRERLIKKYNLTNQRQLWDIENKMERDAQDLFRKHFFSLWN